MVPTPMAILGPQRMVDGPVALRTVARMPNTSPHAPNAPAPAATPGSEIGSKLWSMANTLRAAGARPADYQAYILPILMYKVLADRNADERDRNVAEFGAEFWEENGEYLLTTQFPAGCDFAGVRGAESNLGEGLTDALVKIQEANDWLAGVFLSTDYGKLNDTAVAALLDVLAGISFSSSQVSDDALGAAYEYLLGQFADAAGAKAGQFFTPPSVAKLLARIVEAQPGESAYDPTCGSGGLLNQVVEDVVAHHGADARGTVSLHGQELDEQSAAIARVNFYLHADQGDVVQGDTLLSPGFTDGDQLRRFDVAVANPPFGLENTLAAGWATDRYGRNRWGSVKKKPGELAFVAHIASSLKGSADGDEPTGRAAIVLPMGALFRGGVEAQMRKNLLEGGLVDAVIALPGGMFYNTSIPAAILVLRAQPRTAGEVLFVDATKTFVKQKKQNAFSEAQVVRVLRVLAEREAVDDVRARSVSVADLVEAEGDLSSSRWLPAENSVTVDVPGTLAALRRAEKQAASSASDFWKRLEASGYGR